MNIEHTKGDTFLREIIFEDDAGTPIDITGSTILFTIKNEIGDVGNVIQTTATITDAPNGEALIEVSNTNMEIDVKDYVYDIQWTDIDGIVRTFMKGSFVITYEVTVTV